MRGTGVQPGQTRQDFLSYAVHMAVEEGDDFDLLAMGRPEGQGCYCAANHMLRNIMDGINTGYDWVVMDNEAGMEHLSRRTTPRRRSPAAGQRREHARAGRGRGHAGAEQGAGDQRPQDVPAGEPRAGRPDARAVRAKAEAMGVPLLAALPYDPLIANTTARAVRWSSCLPTPR